MQKVVLLHQRLLLMLASRLLKMFLPHHASYLHFEICNLWLRPFSKVPCTKFSVDLFSHHECHLLLHRTFQMDKYAFRKNAFIKRWIPSAYFVMKSKALLFNNSYKARTVFLDRAHIFYQTLHDDPHSCSSLTVYSNVLSRTQIVFSQYILESLTCLFPPLWSRLLRRFPSTKIIVLNFRYATKPFLLLLHIFTL